ncbi:MAG TPA: branched-chain amino acid ABC transporter permease [Albitalea sp.]
MSALPRPAATQAPPARAAAAASVPVYSFRPWNVGRVVVWSGFALLLAVAPLVFTSGLALTILSQMGIAIVACLSYNMLLGQGGMLSFGHAVYTGLASFVCIHALNAIGAGLALPVSLVPLVGGVAGMLFAVVLGFVTTKKAGTTFAMITLGIGELVFSMSLMIPEFFGGEGGVQANRMVGRPFLGITFGPQIQVYGLLAVYTFVCTAAMFAFTRTPLGRILNAVRDNPERVEFIGYSTQRVRYLAFIASGFFAGVAGGMYALNFEIATAEVVGAFRSGTYLFFTFLGGATFFFGPVIGGVLMVLAFVLFSEFTKAWLLYLGLIFLFMVMYAPGGIASLVMMNLRVAAFGRLRPLWTGYLALGGSAAVVLLAAGALIEMVYHLQLEASLGTTVKYLGATLDTAGADSWVGAAFALLVGIGMFELARRRFAEQWGETQGEIEAEIRRREAL